MPTTHRLDAWFCPGHVAMRSASSAIGEGGRMLVDILGLMVGSLVIGAIATISVVCAATRIMDEHAAHDDR